ncbi:filamin-A-like isoform X1 [Branchiostoma floridae x Branchiostoma japonicum]
MSEDEDSRRVAAYRPKRSTDSRWVEIQKNTFTNWVNESLRPRGESVQELGEDLRDGTRLATLLEALSDRKIPRINRNPINNLQKMDNVSRSLDLMKKEGIKTVNIGNEDVLEGNEKLMLGLIWTLIQHYQISRGSGQRGAKYSPKKHMLLWLQTVLPECRITNLSTDWNDGIALSALVDYCRPGLFPHWRSLNRQDALQNCRNAMDIAEREFNIPQVVSPEDFSDPSLDELSGMTYLSYYVKEDGPGYDAALQALNSLVPEAKVNNFQGDLADGRVLCGMMHQLGGACPSYHSLSSQEASDNIAEALNWGKSLGVTPTFTAEEVTSGQVPSLAIMSYIAQVQAKADPEGRLIRRRSSGFHDENNLLDTEVLTQPELQSSTAVEVQQSMQAEPNAFTPSHAEEPDRGRPDFTFPPPPSSPPPIVAESTTFFVPPSPPASDNDPAETQETARYYSEIPSPVYQPPSPTTYVYAPPSPREEPTPITTHQPLPMSCHQEVAMEMVDEPLIVPEYVAPVFAPPPRSGGYGGLDLSRVSVAGNGVNQAPVGKPADIRITPTGAVGGNFVVEAESPGGRSHPVSLQKERTGYLTGHFTPEEIGQYQVSVKCDGRDVPSSPFNCNVYDPDRVRVMGMNRALLGSLAAFGVETGTAGEGDIDVTVRGPNGRKCPNKIRPEGAGNYRVTYSPNETGWHEVEIEFNGDDIPGSPFRQEVVDSWNVTAEGEGLGPKVTGSQMHEFSVLGTAGGELMVNIQSPSGRRVPETLGARYGDYLCSYVPTEAGMHTIDVAYNGMTVQGSPFHVEVTDASAVSLFPVDQGIIGRPVDFDIDASRAGNGRIDVTVMDGRTSLPVNLSPSGGNRYSASFVPQTANPHDVTVTFEGQNVPRSPFRVNIIDASRVRASGDGLDRVPIGTGTEFFVDSQGGGDADVAVKITGPTGRDVPARVSGGNGHWTVQYTPTEVCDHNIMVTFAGMQIYGSPFLSHCYDINQVQVGDIPNGKMGQPVQVEIDTSRAGHGDLAANVSVNYQNVPCDLRSRGADSYLLTFVPQTTVTHDLVFKFNGSIIPGCPYRCKIVDASQVTAHGDGLDRIPVDRPTNFYIDTSRAGDADIDVRIAGTEAKNVPVKLTGGSGKYVAEYTPTQVGEHQVTVTYAGRQIPGSPFSSYAYDVNQIRVGNIPRGRVGHPVEVFVDATKAGSGVLEATVNCPTDPVTSQMDSIGQDRFKLVFVPRCNHPHDIAFKFNGNVVPGSPYKCYISDASQAQARGDGLDRVPIKTPASFVIDTSRAGNGDVVTIITSPSGRNIPCRLSHQGTLYDAEYVPLEVGDHQIDIHFDQQPIPGSPFHCHVYDVSGVRIREIPQGRVGKTVQVEVDTSLAGRGSLQGDVSVLRNPVASNLSSMDSDRYLMTFVPQSVDPHNIVFKFNGSVVPGSPFPCYILDAGLVRVTGDGLDRVPVNSQTQVFLDATRAGDAEVDVSIKSPSGRAVPTRVSGKGNYTVDYTPTEVGPHKIDAKFGGMEVNGSPFTSYAYDVSKVRVGHVPNGVVGRPVDIDVDTSQAGPGELAAAVTQNYQPIPCTLKHKGGDVYTITFIPQNTQVHDLLFKFNGTIVPGSPFHVYIIDAGLVTVTGEGLDRVPVGRPTDFLVDTTRAGESGLDVSITGPGGRRVPCRPSGHGNYTIEYTPTEVGPHNIDVFFAGLEVPGSPFTSYAYDASQIRVGHVPDGIIGRPVSIEVDTSQAGFGDLMANVSTNYQTVPSTLEGRSSDVWVLTFVPQTVQTHDVVFKFNNDIVPGSPFPVKMIDASSVHASGDGLDRVPVNRPTHFKIDTSRAGDADIVAHITSPSGRKIPCSVYGSSGNFTAEYTPLEAGDHTISVTFAGRTISGSPFTCNVYDVSRVRVLDIPKGIPGKPVYIDVDSSKAGAGELAAIVTHGKFNIVPSTLRGKGDRNKYTLTFIPKTVETHEVIFKFNGHVVPGCPHEVKMIDANRVTASGEGLGRIPIKHPTDIHIDASRTGDAPLSCSIKGPSGQNVPCTLAGSKGSYKATYVPVEVGTHDIDIQFGNMPIYGNPFSSRVYDVGQVTVESIPVGRIGRTAEVKVSTAKAGEGQITANVICEDNIVPSSVTQKPQGKWDVAFIPKSFQDHQVMLKFNGALVLGSPHVCKILNASSVTASGDGVDANKDLRAGDAVKFAIQTNDAGEGEILATVTAPSGKVSSCTILGGGRSTTHTAVYTPEEVGRHRIDVGYAGMPISGSPFASYVYDINKIKVQDVTTGIMGLPVSMGVDATKAGRGELAASVTVDNFKVVPASLLPGKEPKNYILNFTPEVCKTHDVLFKFNGDILPGCPYKVQLNDAKQVTAFGEGLDLVPINKPTSISVDTSAGGGGPVTCMIKSPSGKVVPSKISGTEQAYKATYTPTEIGSHNIQINFWGMPIYGSPFTSKAFDAKQVIVEEIPTGRIGTQTGVVVDASKAGVGTVTAEVFCDKKQIPCSVQPLKDGKSVIAFMPQSFKDHEVGIKFNGLAIPGGPHVCKILGAETVKAFGEGITPRPGVPRGHPATFTINMNDAGNGEIASTVTSPSGGNVPCRVSGRSGNYTAEYTPYEVGDHNIVVTFAGQQIMGSPFNCHVYDARKVRVGDIPLGKVGQPVTVLIDTTQAGVGDLQCTVSANGTVPSHLDSHGTTHNLMFAPRTAQPHELDVKFNGQTVPGSPFTCHVVDQGAITVLGDGLGRVPVDQPANFTVDATRAGDAELKVDVLGPSRRRVPCSISGRGKYDVEYVPTEVGPHTIDVTFAGDTIPGSPFGSYAYDANRVKVLDIPNGRVGEEVPFQVDCTQAGEGELAILVTSAGRAVPSTISPGYGNGIYTGSFVPRDINTHDINVKFSGHTVPGSPFHCHIMDATQVTATGDGLDRVPINQRTWVNIDTRSAGDGDVNVTAMSPSTLSVPVVVRREGQGMWRAEYTPTEVGEHTLDITFVGMPIYGSPFTAYAYDVSKVRVRPDPVGPGQIGKTENFTVDASQAGTGHIDVSVSCERRNVPISVQTKGHGIFDCSFVPRDLPDHLIVVKFNGQIIPNCPMVCEILDAGRVTGSGPGLGVIPINRLTSFSVRDAHKGDISVNIQSPSGRQVPVEVMGPDSHGHLYVTWKPTESGLHTVDVLLGEDHIQGSPFTVRVFDAQKVKVHSLEGGLVGQPHSFIVDTSEAGPGHIRVVIHAGRTEVPHQILDLGGGKYKVTYTPQENVDHMIMVEWNEVAIPAPTGVESRGDQFVVPVADVGLIQASGVGLIGSIPVNSLAQFRVLTHGQTGGDPTIIITAPSRRQVPCHVQPGRGGEYTVEYTPNETGPHRIEVMYASMPINGSPFTSQVYDSSKVRVNDIPNGYIGKPNSFSIDATQAGPGEVTVDVGNPMHVPEQLQNLGGGRYKCDFTPTNTNRHDITVKFNGELVPGNVFHCDVVDAGNVTVTGSGLDLIPVNQPAQFIVDPHGGPPAEVRVNINEPNGRPLPNRVTHQYDGTHLVEYTPKTVGAHPIDVHYAGLLVPGSPFECIAYDANKVRISDIRDGFVGQELGCKIDTSQAGPGTVTAEVQQSGRPVNHYLREDPPGSGRYSLMYTPDAARAHEIRVRFNGQAVQGSPFREEVFDPRNAAAFGEGLGTIPVKKATYFIVDPRSAGKADISANISAPSGNMVPSRVVPGRDGTHKVEYTPYEVGPHQADVFYAGYPINGSPFQPVAYDASAVRVSEIPDGRVGQKIGFNIDTSRAGKGDLDVGVNVNNRNVPFEMDSGRQRDNFEVSFLAQEAGTHRIPISFNGDPVQGSPFRSEIKAAGRASASGEGLYRGQEDRTAEFVVDTTDCDNLPLDIQVDGPNSIAKCSVEHRGDKHYVTYVPVEVGIFDITLKHGGQEIDGSPFHPTVIDPRKVRAKGGWNTFLGSNGRLTLFVNERYTLPLDAAEAGPGKMSSMVRGPTGEIPVDIEKRNDGMHFVSFTPVADGEHVVDVNWSDLPIARSPIYGDARASRDALVSHEKVVVRGRGLREAKVGEEAEFIIDGSEAGPGTPEVMMSGLKNDIDVRMVPMTDRPNSYRCYYYPKVPGAYLLNITWSQRQVNGSPFRVSIAPGIDAKKVTFSGLKEGIMGQALRADIDVREAGKGGTLTARCQGPTKRADIDLKDNMNGTFGLTIRPQEGGRHLLEIKYGGEHIQGSPFVLRIAGATDPSKVRVFGPGLKNGLLHTFKGNFICETRGAGAGQLKVRVHGPRGAFRVEMQPLSSKDRTIAVKYNPVEPGDYDIDVKWSDVHVPGSPFRVSIFETQDELDEFEGRQISRIGGSTSRHSRHSGPEYNSYQWQEEI